MLIDKVFLPFEAQVIKSFPVCLTPQEDILIWPKSKDGMYTVKMGYQFLCEREDKERASVSSFDAAKIFWSGLWKLKVPNKVKTYVWRACTNSLPTLENLLKRKVVLSSICMQ